MLLLRNALCVNAGSAIARPGGEHPAFLEQYQRASFNNADLTFKGDTLWRQKFISKNGDFAIWQGN